MTVLPNSLPKVISIFGIVISLFLILKKDEDIEKDEIINPTFFAGISRFKKFK